MADAGYSSWPLHLLLRRQYDTRDVIDINKGHRRMLKRLEGWHWSAEWKALYSQRQAVERAFSRLKGQRSLNRITVRRRRKVTVHCYLSLIAMQASPSALGAT